MSKCATVGDLDFVVLGYDMQPIRIRKSEGEYWMSRMHPDRFWVLTRKVASSPELWHLQNACVDWEHHKLYECGIPFKPEGWPSHDAPRVQGSVGAMNQAFKADPNAIHSLICNRVPCNQRLADDPYVQVDDSPVLDEGNYQVGALGLVNAVLAANGLPLLAVKFSEEKDEQGRAKLLGFCEYPL